MKRWSAFVLVGAFMIWAIVDIAHDFKANDTIGYFAEKPQRLLYVAAFSLMGGLAAFIYDRSSPGIKHKLRLLLLGTAAAFFTGFAVQMGYGFISRLSFSLPISNRSNLTIILVSLSFACLAMFLWLEFVHILKTGKTRWINKVF